MAGKRQQQHQDFTVSPFTVLIDTREQAPFGFQSMQADARDGKVPLIVPVEKIGLKTGDYSVKELTHLVAVERKSKEDLFHCMGADRERFEQQVLRLSDMPQGFVVVEASWGSVLSGCQNSSLLPKVVHRTVISWQQKYSSVHWWFCDSRGFAEITTYRILEKAWRQHEKNLPAGSTVAAADL